MEPTGRGKEMTEPLDVIRIQTATHRAMNSQGILVKVAWLDEGPTARAWKLAGAGAWTRRELRKVQLIVDAYYGF